MVNTVIRFEISMQKFFTSKVVVSLLVQLLFLQCQVFNISDSHIRLYINSSCSDAVFFFDSFGFASDEDPLFDISIQFFHWQLEF